MRWIIIVVLTISSCEIVNAGSYTEKNTAYVEDGYLASAASTTNYGADTCLRLAAGGTGRLVRIRIRYVDQLLDSLGADSIIACSLKYYVVGANSQGGTYGSCVVRRCLKPFFEGDGTIGDGHPAGQTYSHWRDSTGTTSDSGFQTAGIGYSADSIDNRGDHARPDRFSTSIATVTGKASGWQIVDVTALARLWRAATAAENGVVIFHSTTPVWDATEMTSDTIYVRSSEYTTDTSLTPRFVFYYPDPPAATEPPRYRQGPAGAEVRQGPQGASKRTGP